MSMTDSPHRLAHYKGDGIEAIVDLCPGLPAFRAYRVQFRDSESDRQIEVRFYGSADAARAVALDFASETGPAGLSPAFLPTL